MRSRTRRTIAVAVVAAGLALVGACSGARETTPGTSPGPGASSSGRPEGGSPGGPPSAGAVGNACGLITAGEAASALGVSGDALKAKTNTPGHCEYDAPNRIDSVAVTVEKEEYRPGIEDLVIDMLGKDKVKKEAGLGDAAFSFDVGFQVQFHVWAKGTYLFVVVNKMSEARAVPGTVAGTARSLTEKALSRL